jgi:hypothetical protein
MTFREKEEARGEELLQEGHRERLRQWGGIGKNENISFQAAIDDG